MIAVTLEGRLGNQLFQYAFIYNASRKVNTWFYLDKSVDYLLLDKYFHIENDFWWLFDNYIFSIKGFKNIFSHHLRYKFYNVLKSIFNLKELIIDNDIDPAIQIKLIDNNIVYKGFFQSAEYFKESAGQIHNLFKIKEIYKTEFEKITSIAGLPQEYVVVHIRRKDYIDLNLALGYEYFHEAIKSIHKEENYYVFISDEPGIIEHEFNYIKHKYISFNNEIIDFQFINNADICILSNSSFSWWGAWLNNRENKKVIAPNNWLGFNQSTENPVGVIPSEWKVLNAK